MILAIRCDFNDYNMSVFYFFPIILKSIEYKSIDFQF